jgi:hypothetical protein
MTEIKGSELRPETLLKAHHWRHIISGMIVFSTGIAVDQGMAWYREIKPNNVFWLGNPSHHQTNFSRVFILPKQGNFVVEFGLADDGRVIWKIKE